MAEHDHDHAHDSHVHDQAHEPERAEDGGVAVDESPAPERGQQEVQIEDSGPARKSLTIEVPAERIRKKIEESFGKLRDEAAIPGFRRGRAPHRLIERRFGSAVRDEVKGQLLSECYTQAIEDHQLDVIGEPDIKDVENIRLPDDGPLTFKVEIEVSPQVTLPELNDLTVSRESISVSDEDVTKEIERLRERLGQVKAVPDAVASPGDWLKGDVKIMAGSDAPAEGEPLIHFPETYVQVHGEEMQFRGHVAGLVVEDLGHRLAGKQPGQTVVISMTGPAGHEDDRVRNQPITIHLRIDQIDRLEPASIESVVEQSGLESEQALLARIRETLESRAQQQQRSKLHDQISQQLLDRVQFELPEGLTGRQTARVLRRRALELAYQGVPQPEIEQRIADMRQQSEAEARRQLKLFFILDKAAKQWDIEVSEGEINGRLAALAMQQGRRPEKLRQELARSGDLEYLYLQIREQKTLDKLLEQVKIVEAAAAPDSSPASA